jgi:GT2 family glycosyltransferase
MKAVCVVVSWNSRDDTLACLAALARSEPAAPDVIVVDNASTDGTVAAVRAAFPNVELIENSRNRHFARGANQGLRRALARGAEFAWVLNPDAHVAPTALHEMLCLAASDPALGIIGARLVHPAPHPRSRLGERVVVGANCDLRTGAIDEPAAPDSSVDRLDVDYVWGCAMLLRAAMLRQVGLFDERLVAYFEDADLCLRARAAVPAWRTATALRAVVVHAGSRAANRRFLQQMWLRGRNWLWCFWRHAPAAQRPALLRWMLGYRLPRLAWAALFTLAARTVRPLGRPIKLWS